MHRPADLAWPDHLLQAALPGVEKTQKKNASQGDMSRAMRKMLQLKAAAAAGKPRPVGPAAQPAQRQRQPQPTAPPAVHQEGKEHAAQQQPLPDSERQQSTQPPAAPADHSASRSTPAPPAARGGSAAAAAAGGAGGATATDALFQHKRLKDRKKEFLKAKKLKKQQRRGGSSGSELTEKEAQLAAAAAASRPAFGEQAYQPLKVQLKRKHWAGAEAGRGESRCGVWGVQVVWRPLLQHGQSGAAGSRGGHRLVH